MFGFEYLKSQQWSVALGSHLPSAARSSNKLQGVYCFIGERVQLEDAIRDVLVVGGGRVGNMAPSRPHFEPANVMCPAT
jgi:hypothetical protein